MSKDLISVFYSLKSETREPGNLYDTLSRIAENAKKHFSADICVIFPINPVTNKFLREKPMIIGSLLKVSKDDFKTPREIGLAQLVLSKKVLLVEEDRLVDFRNPVTDLEQIHAFAAFALYTSQRQKPLAVIYLDYRTPRKFDKAFQSEAETFIELASSELQNTWFIRRYREITKIGHDINENLERIDDIFEKVLAGVRGIIDISYYFSLAKYNVHKNDADLYLVEEGGRIVSNKNFPLENSISSWVIENLTPLMINDIDKDALPEGVRAVHIEGTKSKEKSLIFVPLKISNRPLGVISVQHPEPNHYNDDDKQILELLANHISSALNNIRLLDDLRKVDKSGQILTQNLDSTQDIINEVVDFIYQSTQADIVILYPYIQSENKYLKAISKGHFISKDSLRQATADTNTLVHIVNNEEEPIFADDSLTFYSRIGMEYSSKTKFPSKEKILSTAAIPLKVSSESIGVIFFNFRNRQKFDDAQKWTISSLSTYAAIAIRNSRLVQKLRERRTKELGGLQEIDRTISQILDLDKNLQTILELTTNHLKADTGVILLYNRKMNAIEAKVGIGDNLPPLEKQVYPLDQFQGIAKTAFNRKTTIRIDDVQTDPEWKNIYREISGNTISEMDVPLLLGEEAIGVMNFESTREAAFSKDDQEFMETLAGQAVIAIKNAIEYERAQRIAQERQALIDIVNTLLLQTDQKEIFSIILDKALEITDTDKGTINTCDETRREIKVVVDKGLKPELKNGIQSFDMGIIGRAVREKRVIKIDKISTDPLREEFFDAFPGTEESELAVPIFNDGKVIGVINLESENPFHFEKDDVELIKSLASLCAVAIKNVESVHQKELASVGIITGDISHKMNSPLSKIQKQIELIELGCQDELAKNAYLAEKISQINTITSGTIQMVRNLVEQAKNSFASVEKTSLKLLLQSTLSEMEIPENIRLDDNVSESKDLLDVLATLELSNVFQNLITNSIRAMAEGGVITVAVDNIDENWIIISVEDTGKGIPDHVAPLVYLPVSEQETEGHGFGLPLTKAYIEMIGGKMDIPVKGKDGVGTRFTIHLRRAKA